jgi:hypothetical protein
VEKSSGLFRIALSQKSWSFSQSPQLRHVLTARDNLDNPLAAEILQEAAEAYFAACRKMVASLEALRAFECAITGVSLKKQFPISSNFLSV